jgi:hypothetical protein
LTDDGVIVGGVAEATAGDVAEVGDVDEGEETPGGVGLTIQRCCALAACRT